MNESLENTKKAPTVRTMAGDKTYVVFKDDNYTCGFDYSILNMPAFKSFQSE